MPLRLGSRWIGRVSGSRAATFAVLTLGTLSGCGSSEKGGNRGSGGSANTPPAWGEPKSIELLQGTWLDVDVTLEDADGDAVSAAVTAPAGVEAALTPEFDRLMLSSDYSASGPLELDVQAKDARGAVTSTKVPLDVKPIRWLDPLSWSSDGPEPREHGAFVVDEAARRVILIGGSGYSPYLEPFDDVWQLDIESHAWTRLTPTGDVLSGGGSRRVAQIPGESSAYLFGGYGVDGASHDELYRVDFSNGGVAFKRLTQVGSPGGRALHAFVYDPQTRSFYVFGGGGAGLLGDTKKMTLAGDTATWTPMNPFNTPSPRYGFFYGFDAASGRLIVFSGAQGGGANLDPARDTWALDVRATPPDWKLLDDGASADSPPGRRNGCHVLDTSVPRLFVFGGTADAQTTETGLFVFDARPGKEKWKRLELAGAPEVRSSGFGFYDAESRQTLLGFGNTSAAVFQDLNPIGY